MRARCIAFRRKPCEYQPGPPASDSRGQDEVRAAVSNLIDNAVKYSGGEVKVTVETAQVDGRYVTMRVKDQGSGHSQEPS